MMQSEFFDRETKIPVYRQLADHIKKQISSGIYKPGDVLPSEADYIRDFNVSRTTVRLAFGLVTNAGMVRREQGRGTIVVPQVVTHLPFLSSFTEEAIRYGRSPSVIQLDRREEQIDPSAAKALRLPEDAVVLRVERLRLVDGEPIGLAISWLNTILYPRLLEVNFTATPLYQVFEKMLNLSIYSARENIRANLAEEHEAHVLRIKLGSPVLRMLRTTFVQNEQGTAVPLEYVDVVFNGSVYSVDVELFRKSGQ